GGAGSLGERGDYRATRRATRTEAGNLADLASGGSDRCDPQCDSRPLGRVAARPTGGTERLADRRMSTGTTSPSRPHASDPSADRRFPFGRNWRSFLRVVDEARIQTAAQSLVTMLDRPDLRSVRFLDAGCGSGLFSLAARRLGATVVSFDVDHDSVACTRELRRRYFPGDTAWDVREGSVLGATRARRGCRVGPESSNTVHAIPRWSWHVGLARLDRLAGRLSVRSRDAGADPRLLPCARVGAHVPQDRWRQQRL